ncbi:MAG: endopeptidase [Betaproteobacteria bacterium]|jgi:STE24 endopeptidase|nr:endopeptidase [Betaproteobacteria bacterium]
MNSSFNSFTWIFLAALAAATATRCWLARRQIRHVRAHRDAVPPMFAETIPVAAHQKAADYTAAKTGVGVIDLLVETAVVLALTLGGGIEMLGELWGRLFQPGSLAHGTALLLSFFLVQALVGLPLSLYRIFGIEQRFGFNRMTWRLYLSDLAKQTALVIVLGLPVILAVLWLMQHMGPRWWLYAWLVLTAFTIVLQLIFPAVILPLFNKFTPVAEGELAQRVGALLERCGFKSRGLYMMDGSKRSSHGNAFFAGFGATKRIVLFDTLINRLEPTEVEAVLAHELGHYKLHHIVKMIALSTAMTLAGLWVLGQLMHEPWFYAGLGVKTPGMAAALALFVLVVPPFTFFLHPLTSLLSRKHEFEADAYAKSNADAAQLAQALVKLYRDNASTLTPDPLHSAFYDSHPPAAARIARLRTA